jgi:hypothetical protein
VEAMETSEAWWRRWRPGGGLVEAMEAWWRRWKPGGGDGSLVEAMEAWWRRWKRWRLVSREDRGRARGLVARDAIKPITSPIAHQEASASGRARRVVDLREAMWCDARQKPSHGAGAR